MLFNKSHLFFIGFLSLSFQACSMESGKPCYVPKNRMRCSGPSLKLITALSLISHNESYILESPIPQCLKEYLLDIKKKMSIDGLLEAVKIGDKKTVKFILRHGHKKGITLNAQNKDGDTPLMIGARYNQVKLVEFFLAKNARVNLWNNKRITPLQEALSLKHTDIVKLFRNNIEAIVLLDHDEAKQAFMLITDNNFIRLLLNFETGFLND